MLFDINSLTKYKTKTFKTSPHLYHEDKYLVTGDVNILH